MYIYWCMLLLLSFPEKRNCLLSLCLVLARKQKFLKRFFKNCETGLYFCEVVRTQVSQLCKTTHHWLAKVTTKSLNFSAQKRVVKKIWDEYRILISNNSTFLHLHGFRETPFSKSFLFELCQRRQHTQVFVNLKPRDEFFIFFGMTETGPGITSFFSNCSVCLLDLCTYASHGMLLSDFKDVSPKRGFIIRSCCCFCSFEQWAYCMM